jgi:hypothetical protein
MARGGRLAVGPGPRVGVALLGNWFHHMVESHSMLHRRRGTAAGRVGDPLPSLAAAGLGSDALSASVVITPSLSAATLPSGQQGTGGFKILEGALTPR